MKVESKLTKKSWWNRPLFGEISLWERILGLLYKQNMPELALSLYDRELEGLNKIEPTLRMLDNEQYSAEFLFYITIKQKIDHDLDEYKGLANFIKVFSFTSQHIKHFRVLSRIELDFRGKTQVKLYDFIEQKLNSLAQPKVIRDLIIDEITRLIENTRNEPTKKALKSYKSALQSILKKDSGVKVLGFLKNNKITNYSIFNVIYFLIKEVKGQDLQNLKSLVSIVKIKEDELEKLAQLIGLPDHENQTIIYAKIIQYIALSYRFENITFRFEQLLEKLNQWYKHYRTIIEIKQEYPPHKYHNPRRLSQTLPGESIYLKYKDVMISS